MQLLEDTLAVLSLGKLCEEHGYTYEWVSGQKKRLSKEGKRILCKTENFVLDVLEFVVHIVPAASPSPARLRSNDTHEQRSGDRGDLPKIKNKLKMRTTIKQREIDCSTSQSGQRSSQDNLEDTEVPPLANTSNDSDSERLVKVAARKHSIETHFPKRPKVQSMQKDPRL